MSTQEKMLERVRALLAKAASTNFPEEAEAFQAKADELMTKYAIEMWQIEQAQAGVNAPRKPVRKDLDISWWYKGGLGEIRSDLWNLYHEVARHCRVVPVGQKTEYRSGESIIPVIGLEADLAYFDMLFTHLLMQFLDRLDPKPRPGETMIEALVKMKEAGLKWEVIYNRLKSAGLVEDLGYWNGKVASRMDFAGKYTKFCRDMGRDRVYTSPAVYRRSFADGWTSGVIEKLREMREDQGQSTGSMALALRDIRLVVREAMWDEFPDLRPHPDDCDCDKCHRCDDPKCQRPRCKAARKPVPKSFYREVTVDYGVIGRGRKEGREAEILSNSPNLKSQRGLPS